MDWDAVLARAERAGIMRLTLVGLQLPAMLFDSALPDVVKKAIAADAAVGLLTSDVVTRLQSAGEKQPEPKQLLRYRENLSDRLRFYWGLVFHPTENEWAETKSSSALLHRFVRLKRLAGKLTAPGS
jgi:hypothetical protein